MLMIIQASPSSDSGDQMVTDGEISNAPSQEFLLKLEEQYQEKEALWKGRNGI